MDQAAVIKIARDLFEDGEPEEALNQLITFFETDPKYSTLKGLASVAKSRLNAVERQISKGLRSYDNASPEITRIKSETYQIIEFLENGELEPEGEAPVEEKKPSWRFIFQTPKFKLALTMLTFGLVLATAWMQFGDSFGGDERRGIENPTENGEKPDDEETVDVDAIFGEAECPTFSSSAETNIIILPFFSSVLNQSKSEVSKKIRRELNSLGPKYGLSLLDTKIHKAKGVSVF